MESGSLSITRSDYIRIQNNETQVSLESVYNRESSAPSDSKQIRALTQYPTSVSTLSIYIQLMENISPKFNPPTLLIILQSQYQELLQSFAAAGTR